MSRGAAGLHAAPALASFLRPGILHELGNALFTIRGHVEVGMAGGPAREHVVDACRRAEAALAVLRDLGGSAAEPAPVALDEVVRRLVAVARVPLRECGVVLEFDTATTAAAAKPVDGAVVVPAVTAALLALVDRLADGFEGRLRLELGGHDDRPLLRLAVEAAAGHLPFPLDRQAVVAEVRAMLGDSGVQVEAEPGLQLRF